MYIVTTSCRNSPFDTTGILNFLVSSRANGNCSSRAAMSEFQHQWSDVTRENNCVANDIANSPFIVPTTTTHKTFWYIPNPPISCRIPPASTLKAAVMFEGLSAGKPDKTCNSLQNVQLSCRHFGVSFMWKAKRRFWLRHISLGTIYLKCLIERTYHDDGCHVVKLYEAQ